MAFLHYQIHLWCDTCRPLGGLTKHTTVNRIEYLILDVREAAVAISSSTLIPAAPVQIASVARPEDAK